MDFLQRLDTRLFLDVNAFARHTGWLHTPMVDYAEYGVVVFGVLLVTGLVWARNRDDRTLAAAGWAPVATLLAVAINQPVGRAVHEARPYTTHPHILMLVTRSTDYSFPSDHAVMAGAVTAGLWLVWRRLGLIAAAAAVLLAFARVYVAAHYPWDVAAGLLLGAAVTVVTWILLRVPLISLTSWLRRQAGISSVFAESDDVRTSVQLPRPRQGV